MSTASHNLGPEPEDRKGQRPPFPTREQILDRLDVVSEFKELGVVFTGKAPKADGWQECHALGTEQKTPSAAVNIRTGRYNDAKTGEEVDLFQLRVDKLLASTIGEAKRYYAEKASLAPKKAKPNPTGNRKIVSYPTFEAALEMTRDNVAFGAGVPKEDVRVRLDDAYTDADGNVLFHVIRFEPKGQAKQIRPIRPLPDGRWSPSQIPGNRPLFRLPEVIKHDGPVWLVEGEKCVHAAESLGVVATTSAGGSAALGKTDWSPLVGRDLVILPDNDDPGRKYAANVVETLKALGSTGRYKVLDLPGIKEGQDLADWVPVGVSDASVAKQLRGQLVGWADKLPWTPLIPPKPEEAPPKPEDDELDLAVTCAATIKTKPIRWLAPGRIALGKLTLLGGEGGAGKSSLTLELAARVTTGDPMFGGQTFGDVKQPADVLILANEDDWADTQNPRLLAAQADLERVHVIDGVAIRGKDGEQKKIPFTLHHLAALRTALRKRPAVRLVVVDPIGSLTGRSGIDGHNAAELGALLEPLAQLAAEHNVAVLLVAHLNKGTGAKAVHRIMGSISYVNSSRAAFVVAADPDEPDQRILSPVKFNLGKPPQSIAYRIGPPPDDHAEMIMGRPQFEDLDDADRAAVRSQLSQVQWVGETSRTADDCLGSKGQGEGSDKQVKAKQWLIATLKAAPGYSMPSEDILVAAEEQEFSRSLMFRIKKTMPFVKAGKDGMSGPWHWILNPYHASLQTP